MIIALSLTCVSLLVGFSTKGQEIKIADSLLAARNFELASVYYEKAIFHADNPKDYNSYLRKQADLYKKVKKFDKSAEALERINKSNLTTLEKSDLFYQLSFSYFMIDNYAKSYFNWLQYEIIVSQDPSEDALLLKTLLFAKLEKWKESQNAFLAYTKDSSNSSQEVFSAIEKIKKKSPEKAENLSYIIPGAGQVYAGKPLRGLTSFAIQGGLLAFAAYNFFNGYYFSGTFTGVSLFYVFYMGGARHAGYLAEEYNKTQNEKAYNLINDLIREHKKRAINRP